MIAIIGLGNIGPQYEKTRHNAGLMLIDLLATEEWKEEKKLKAFTSKIKIAEKEVLLAKPSTFMNLSGEAVSKILNYYKIPLEDLIVIFDDVDLPLGEIRVRHQGTAGTHNGVKSVIHEIGSENFSRIKIGIENMRQERDLSAYVLGKFSEEELKILKKALEEGKKLCRQLVEEK